MEKNNKEIIAIPGERIINKIFLIRGKKVMMDRDLAELYGVAATRDHKKLELHIELEEWRTDRAYDRIGLDERSYDILGVKLRSLLVPVRPARDIAGIVEVAARNFLLQLRGHHAAQDLKSRIDAEMSLRERRRPAMELERASVLPGTKGRDSADLNAAAQISGADDHIEDEVE